MAVGTAPTPRVSQAAVQANLEAAIAKQRYVQAAAKATAAQLAAARALPSTVVASTGGTGHGQSAGTTGATP